MSSPCFSRKAVGGGHNALVVVGRTGQVLLGVANEDAAGYAYEMISTQTRALFSNLLIVGYLYSRQTQQQDFPHLDIKAAGGLARLQHKAARG
jgi:hypothetical protein